jgi:uncharacterized peroxidase-related enzyme
MPQPAHLWKLDIPSTEPTEEDLKKYWAKCVEKLGMVPNVIRAVSTNPRKARTFIAMYNELMLGESGLSKLEREMIAVVVSSANRCFYCLVAHGQAVRRYSGDPQLGEMMVMNYRVAELPARQRAMLDFAWKLTTTPFDVGDEDRAALRRHGFAEQDIYDACDVVGFFNMSNRMAQGTEMIPNADLPRDEPMNLGLSRRRAAVTPAVRDCGTGGRQA